MSETTNGRSHHVARRISLAALLSLFPAAAAAQMPASLDMGGDEAVVAHQKADLLLARLRTDYWPEAAGLLEQAAAARAPGDTTAVNERVAAAELFHVTGSLQRAQSNLERAAREAIADDRIFQAAIILLKAAIVAQERGLAGDATDFARSAEWLSRSSRLTPTESARIRAGIIWSPLSGYHSDT